MHNQYAQRSSLGYGTCSANDGAGGWNCQHRWNAVAGMVGFFNTVSGTQVTAWQQGNAAQIAFSRGLFICFSKPSNAY